MLRSLMRPENGTIAEYELKALINQGVFSIEEPPKILSSTDDASLVMRLLFSVIVDVKKRRYHLRRRNVGKERVFGRRNSMSNNRNM
jgi:hypothetical protein